MLTEKMVAHLEHALWSGALQRWAVDGNRPGPHWVGHEEDRRAVALAALAARWLRMRAAQGDADARESLEWVCRHSAGGGYGPRAEVADVLARGAEWVGVGH